MIIKHRGWTLLHNNRGGHFYNIIHASYMKIYKHNTPYYACTRFLCMHKILVCAQQLVHAQHSCACTRFLCMHNTLVHAQHSCACTGGARARDQGGDPTKNSRGSGPGRLFFCWVPALVPGPSSACTRVLCMHKNLVHTQFLA